MQARIMLTMQLRWEARALIIGVPNGTIGALHR